MFFWELNDSLQKVVFRHKNNGLRMRRGNAVAFDCFVSLDLGIPEKPGEGLSSQFHELFLMV